MEDLEWEIDEQEIDDVLDHSYFSELQEDEEIEDEEDNYEMLTSDHLLREL